MFSPDGQRLGTAGSDQTIKLWDVRAGHELLTLRGHMGAVFSVAFSPDGRRLASAGRDGTVRFWDATPLDEKTLRCPPLRVKVVKGMDIDSQDESANPADAK
jgi:WD40 repeat protein